MVSVRDDWQEIVDLTTNAEMQSERPRLAVVVSSAHSQPVVTPANRSFLAKRALDLVLGGLMALLAVPLILLFAAAQAVTLRAWPFFVQRRIGRGGRAFSIVKIRTLPRHVPAYMLKTELGQVRLPALSRFLRAHHLDELPQLFLVPLGTLSLVGPRPKMPDAAEPVDEHYGRMRVQVPQGCTGLWQISPHKGELPHEAPMYDRFYVQHSSLALDLWILAKTMLVMTRLSAPVALDGMPAWVVRRAGVPLYAGRAGQPRRPSRREGEFPQLAFGSSRLES